MPDGEFSPELSGLRQGEMYLPIDKRMERIERLDAEIRILRSLCRETVTRNQRLELLQAVDHCIFIEPEHQIVFESLRSLLVRGPVSPAGLAVHLNNRGFPDLDMEKYFHTGSGEIEDTLKLARALHDLGSKHKPSERGFGKVGAAFVMSFLALAAILVFFAHPVRRFVRESLMQSVTSSHYEILCPPGAISQESMTQFASQREPLFTSLDRKLNDAASNTEIKIIFDSDSAVPGDAASNPQSYEVAGTTVRTKLNRNNPQLSPTADAEALLHAAWGKPGSPLIGHWTAIWLVGEWKGQELGMAAAEAEQRLGHQNVAILLGRPPGEVFSQQDRALLGAAWVNEIAELAGPAEVHKLYNAQIAKLGVVEVSRALGTTSLELERKWQMWIYAYIAGMPAAPHSMTMPMDMPMPK
jgi:hypothetical protein